MELSPRKQRIRRVPAALLRRRSTTPAPFQLYLVDLGRAYAQRGCAFAEWFAVAAEFRQFAMECLLESLARSPARLRAALVEMNRFVDAAVAIVGEEYGRFREQAAEQRGARDASPPALALPQHLLMLPVAGTLSVARVAHLRELLLDAAGTGRTRAVIVDFTGTNEVQPDAAPALSSALVAAKTMGANIVLAGLGPQPAQTLARAGLLAGQWTTANDLRDALVEVRRLPPAIRKR